MINVEMFQALRNLASMKLLKRLSPKEINLMFEQFSEFLTFERQILCKKDFPLPAYDVKLQLCHFLMNIHYHKFMYATKIWKYHGSFRKSSRDTSCKKGRIN